MTDQNPIDKKSLSERDICTKFITPAIKDVAGWDIMQFSEEFTLGKRVEQLLSLCDALEARLQSLEEERGRLVAAAMSNVGGRDGE